VLRQGQRTSDSWTPAVVSGVSCDGRFALERPGGARIQAALESGIQEHHLRKPAPARTVQEELVMKLTAAEKEFEAAQQAVNDAQREKEHKERIVEAKRAARAKAKAQATRLKKIDDAIEQHSAKLLQLKQQRFCAEHCSKHMYSGAVVCDQKCRGSSDY